VESGRFHSFQEASAHHGIKGAVTVREWVRRFGKGHLLTKVVRVEQIGEADLILALRRQVAHLEKSLGQTQAQSLLNEAYLKLACEQMGEDPEVFKKKSDGKQSMPAAVRGS
jgi:transposase-like protein